MAKKWYRHRKGQVNGIEMVKMVDGEETAWKWYGLGIGEWRRNGTS